MAILASACLFSSCLNPSITTPVATPAPSGTPAPGASNPSGAARTPVITFNTPLMVAGGGNQSCAVVNGAALCWGDNTYGQLGNHSLVNSSIPIPVNGLGPTSGTTSIATGQQHACALVGGAVQCWGANDGGQLGNGSIAASQVPFQVAGLAAGVTAISAQGSSTCAVVGGAAKCWGNNSDGQLGNTTTNNTPIPVAVTGLSSGVTGISVGAHHSCAIVGGGLQCWGSNQYGELGNNTTSSTPSTSPVQVQGLTTGVTSVAVGLRHTCAVVSGALECWGANQYGSLGNNTTTNSSVPTAVTGLSANVTAVAAGNDHTCAIVSRAVQCWGNNFYGEVGNGTAVNSLVPVVIIATGATAIATGPYHTCAAVNQGVACWGFDYSGQLGFNQTFNAPAPVPVTGLNSAITNGAAHTCAVLNGAAQCWGENLSGQLGNASTTNASTPVAVQGLGLLSGVSGISAGSYHSCAVVNQGAQCWGDNGNGQLGDGTTNNSNVPVEVHGLGYMANVSAIVAGQFHSCAIVNGYVKCWGDNSFGQLGNGGNGNSATPVYVLGLTSVFALASGLNHTCAISNASGSGSLFCWGENQSGQLGNNSTTSSNFPVAVQGFNSGVTSVSAGMQSSCAIQIGAVQCWGSNAQGQLGNNSITDSHVPVQVQGLVASVTAVGVGLENACAVVSGALQCWGSNQSGQLGNSTASTTPSLTPVAVQGLSSGVSSVSAGTDSACALVNGNLQCWGSNQVGQLGNNSLVDNSIPGDVTGL